jgi:hypothetical protein
MLDDAGERTGRYLGNAEYPTAHLGRSARARLWAAARPSEVRRDGLGQSSASPVGNGDPESHAVAEPIPLPHGGA